MTLISKVLVQIGEVAQGSHSRRAGRRPRYLERSATARAHPVWSFAEECAAAHHHAPACARVGDNPDLPTVLSFGGDYFQIGKGQVGGESLCCSCQGQSHLFIIVRMKGLNRSDATEQHYESTPSWPSTNPVSDCASPRPPSSISHLQAARRTSSRQSDIVPTRSARRPLPAHESASATCTVSASRGLPRDTRGISWRRWWRITILRLGSGTGR